MRNLMKRYRLSALFAAFAFALLTLSYLDRAVVAQVPSVNAPFNIDLGALITNTARGSGTVSANQQTNLDKSGVVCTFNATATSLGGIYPQVSLVLQNFDSASGQYYTIVSSSASSPNLNTPITVVAHDGVQTASLPNGITSVGLPVTRLWRVQQVLTGNGTVTGTVGCNAVK